MITLIAMIIYVCWLGKEDEIKFIEECNRSKYLIAFVGLMAVFETIVEVILGIIKLIFKKK